jgi:UDP-glucose 4-epimerase
MNVLVTGGAGYVGSVVTEELLKEGHNVVVLDNLQQGHREAVLSKAIFVLADICKIPDVEKVFASYNFDAVMHMAAETVVEYSMTDPKRYFQGNVTGGLNLLNTMLKHDVHRLIFSSTASVYGEPQNIPIEENDAKNPINSYGESKLIFERILNWYSKAYGLRYVAFRYFCAAGATELLGEDHRPETHLIPNVLRAALRENEALSIFGSDYPTKDGSCLRDFIHVVDISRAHVLALEKLESLSGRTYNLGNAKGYSIFEVVETAQKITGEKIKATVCPRRSGDPAVLVASSSRARSELNWKPRFSELESIIESAWKWLKQHPHGYKQ